jgi:hypothetical protein
VLRIAVDMAEQLHYERRLHRGSQPRALRSRPTPVGTPTKVTTQLNSSGLPTPEAELRAEVDKIRERLHAAMLGRVNN